MYCLNCHEAVQNPLNWENLIIPSKLSRFCTVCREQLQCITAPFCELCYKYSSEKVCADCLWWASETNDALEKNVSVYTYNEMIQSIIARWKYRGDYELGYVFQDQFRKVFKHVFGDIGSFDIVPIPLGEERFQERGFNQAEMLARFLTDDVADILIRTTSEKQAKKTRSERVLGGNPFELKKTIQKSIILVDDIYTTGATVRHAARILKDNGAPVVRSFTLIRSSSLHNKTYNK